MGRKEADERGSTAASAAGQRNAPSVALLIETSREFGRGLLHGIARYSRLHGPWRFFRRPGALDSALPHWTNWQIDGAIVRDVRKVENVIPDGVPVVYVQHSRENYAPFPSIITDSQTIGRMGAEHLLDRGFEHFAYCGLGDFLWSSRRQRSFTDRVRQAGLEVAVYPVPRSKTQAAWKNEQYLLADWVASLPRPLGLMCCNDDRALQVLEACQIARRNVPDDVAVLGVDNDTLVCDLADPPISSVALNTEAAGFEAARLLDSLMHGESMMGQKVLVSAAHVVTRVSTDVLAVTDPDVAAALRYIRRNPNRPLQVSDVVEVTAASRRVLEKKFRTILRRSVHQEIRRARVEHIISLLLDSDMSVGEIALQAGFGGIEHVARYFRKETGMSLREYRRRYSPQ